MEDSPILDIKDHLAKVPFRIAPERAAQLYSWTERESISLNIDLTGRKGIPPVSVSIDTHTVTATIQFLEVLWSTVRLHYLFYSLYDDAFSEENDEFHFRLVPQIATAITQYELAWENTKNSTSNNIWVDSLPAPAQNISDKFENGIQELFLSSFAWVIHHEFAHLRLRHGIALSSRPAAEEKEADLFATDWVVPNESESEGRVKRILGSLNALLVLLDYDVTNSLDATHPHPATRLDDCIEHLCLDAQSDIYRYVAIVLQFKLAYTGYRVTSSGSYKDIYSEFLLMWSRLTN